MSLNPLHKLRRFSSAPVATIAPETPKPAPAPVATTKVAPAPRELTQTELVAMTSPEAFTCKHCKCKDSDTNRMSYSKGANYAGWYCVKCWSHRVKHKEFPPEPIPRVIPKKV